MTVHRTASIQKTHERLTLTHGAQQILEASEQICTKLRLALHAHQEGSDSAILASHLKSLEIHTQRAALPSAQPATQLSTLQSPERQTQPIPAQNFAAFDCSVANLGDFSIHTHYEDDSYYSECSLGGLSMLDNSIVAFSGYTETSDGSLDDTVQEGHQRRCSTPTTPGDGSVQNANNGNEMDSVYGTNAITSDLDMTPSLPALAHSHGEPSHKLDSLDISTCKPGHKSPILMLEEDEQIVMPAITQTPETLSVTSQKADTMYISGSNIDKLNPALDHPIAGVDKYSTRNEEFRITSIIGSKDNTISLVKSGDDR